MAKPRSPKGRAKLVHERLALEYPDAECELDHRNPFELLTATILSAQTTDVRVNMVTPALFAKFPTAADLAAANPSDVEEIIRSTGFYQAKTRNIMAMAQLLLDKFDGEVPTELDDLVSFLKSLPYEQPPDETPNTVKDRIKLTYPKPAVR